MMFGVLFFSSLAAFFFTGPSRNGRVHQLAPKVAQTRNPTKVFQVVITISGLYLFGLSFASIAIVIIALALGRIVSRLNDRDLTVGSRISIIESCSIVDHIRMCLAAGLSVPQAVVTITNIHADVDALQQMKWKILKSPSEALREFGADQPHLTNAMHLLERSFVTGAPSRSGLAALSEHMRNSANQDITRRVRAVAVKSVMPLGLCFLPAFVLITVVPLAVGLFSQSSL